MAKRNLGRMFARLIALEEDVAPEEITSEFIRQQRQKRRNLPAIDLKTGRLIFPTAEGFGKIGEIVDRIMSDIYRDHDLAAG